MSTFLTILILIASLLMIGVVLIQKSKGGGLASTLLRLTKSWVYARQPMS